MITEIINIKSSDLYLHREAVEKSLRGWLNALSWSSSFLHLSPGDKFDAFHYIYGGAVLKAYGEKGVVDCVILTRQGVTSSLDGYSTFTFSLTWYPDGESDDYISEPWPPAVKMDVLTKIMDQALPTPFDCAEETYNAHLAEELRAVSLEWEWWKRHIQMLPEDAKIGEHVLSALDILRNSSNPAEPSTTSAAIQPKATHIVTPKTPPAVNSAGCIAYRRASDIQAKPIRWLWQGRIARGKVSILAGNPGLGKSQITASMAAVITTTGGTWPVDHASCERGNVIILSAEDDAEDTIRPRLEAAGADLSRVFILDAVVEAFRPDGGEIRRAFNLKTDLTRLGTMLNEIGGAALIVIDPITAYLGETDSHKNAEIRALLSPLSDMAAKYEAAVVCVTHLNKSNGGEALARVTGSLAFVAAARSAWLVAKDQENDARRLFIPMKNNIGNDKSGLAFSVESAQVQSTAGVIDTSRVVWESEAVTLSADEAMTSQGDPEERSALGDARQFLIGLLSDGPVSAKQIQSDANGAGLNWRTIQRAADRLGVERRKGGMREGWTWALPSEDDKKT